MNSLRVETITITDSTNLVATFTYKLATTIGISNVSIVSVTNNVPDAKVTKVQVNDSSLKITCQPLTPYSSYNVIFSSTQASPFKSFNGEVVLSEDGVANLQIIIGPPEPNNIFRDYIRNFLRDNIYNAEDPNTIIYKVIESFVNNLSKALYDVRQVKNENYLSNIIENEEKTRGTGPFDRLDEESAYEIIRVGLTPSGNKVPGQYSIDSFPSYPFTLQSAKITKELLTPNSINIEGSFNINDLILNLKSYPITRLTKLTFVQSNGPINYEYNIDTLGYQIKNNTYDKDFGFKYLLLNDNQIKLNDNILSDKNFNIDSILRIECSYEYKDTGKIVYADSLTVANVLTSSRETLPPIINIFDLKHAPIVNANNVVPELGGVLFVDPNNIDMSAKHPAFMYEIPFRLEHLPSLPGQYSIDYLNGRVYVYGSTLQKLGTGDYPPVATYKYRFSYQNQIDYVYDEYTKDLVSLPKGSLRNNEALINFNYEKVLIPNKDYVANVHKESLQERIDNRLLNLGTIRSLNSPVTNVFRIYNETSGELYQINRWNDDKIYFDYNLSPKLNIELFEKAIFENILNEVLFVNSSYANGVSIKIYKCFLNNNTLISATDDCIGSSINSSATFSNKSVFKFEKYYQENATSQTNTDNLLNVGEYCIDYNNGIVYCAVSPTQDYNIGTVSYKKNNIITTNKHIISVDDIYYQISPINPKNKTFSYQSFGDNSIIPIGLQKSNESYYNENLNYAYIINNNKIGFFDDFTFNNKVTEQIKYIRGIFEKDDVINNFTPINFYISSSFFGNSITVSPIKDSLITYVKDDGNLYVNLPQNVQWLSPNISYKISIIRNSDNVELWDSGGQIVAGNPIKLILSGINAPASGDSVTLSYEISINNLSNVVVDYNKGDLYVDYTRLIDEIVISYEYGDNVIDFRQSNALSKNDTYYVSYKTGALRDALLKNFGTMLFVPELNVFNVNLDRERYRDALTGALSSFLQGPTINGIKNLVNKITHINPEIIESAFNTWSLGYSLLYPGQIKTSGNFQLLPAKFNNGVLVDSDGQSIRVPRSSNLSLNQGTFETWIIPQWDGIDNNSTLTFKILKDGLPLAQNLIFVGDSEYHPELIDNSFSLNKLMDVSGVPQKNKNGVFIYYSKDASELFNRWYVDVIDDVDDGYKYTIQISSEGVFYDLKSLNSLASVTTTTTTNKATIKINNLKQTSQIITFICDKEYYILDSGDKDKNRISIYKEVGGYLNFKIYDKYKNIYTIGADVSSWNKNEKHLIAASWKLNSDTKQDEMHLFIDGFEVPNIIKYGQKLAAYPHEKFRTINPEIIVASSTKNIVGSTDLSTAAGSNIVTSSINFDSYGIVSGDIIYIEDPLFDENGYTINGVSPYPAHELELNANMPATLDNLKFSINKTSYPLSIDANIYTNVSISTISVVKENVDLSTTINSNIVESLSSNFSQIKVGYLIRILDNNFNITYTIIGINGTQLTLDQEMPVTMSGLSFYIYSNEEKEIPGMRATLPSYQISSDENYNAVLTVTSNVKAKDLLILNTFGLNHKKVKQNYYSWSDKSENIIQTKLPTPISLNDVNITRVIFPNCVVGPSNSSFILGEFNFVVTNAFNNKKIIYNVFQPSISDTGRSIYVSISGTNVDFSSPVTITIDGYNYDLGNFTETVTLSDYGKQDLINKFVTINDIIVTCKPLNPLRDCLAIEVKEKYPITYSEQSDTVATIRYSYQMNAGVSLYGDGYIATDGYSFFSSIDVSNVIVIQSPIQAAGTYKITGVSEDHKSINIDADLPSFTDGVYRVLNITDYRTGLQNGFFVLENFSLPGEPYYLNNGFYEIEYNTYTNIQFDPMLNEDLFIGSNIYSSNQCNSILDQTKIYGIKLSDTRVGETISVNQRSITKDFNSLVELKADTNTLLLLDYNSYPFKNLADYYIKNIGKYFIQSDLTVNDSFQNSVKLTKNPIILDNYGILSKKEGTIEFWVNTLFDSANDPTNRYYFDAYGAKVVTTNSLNNSQIMIDEPIGKVISVTIDGGDQSVNYFAGGFVDIATSNATLEEVINTNTNSVSVKNRILQVLSVRIKEDLTNTNYFANGAVGSDKKTIFLGKQLPSTNLNIIVTYKTISGSDNKLNHQIINLNKKLPKDNCSVIVKFVPKGFNGDRISIFKDSYGYLNFEISAGGKLFNVSAPIFWSRGAWHKVKTSYKLNSQTGSDEIRLFVDGYERSNLLINDNLNFNTSSGFGAGTFGLSVGQQSITFNDAINQIYIGSDYSLSNGAYCIMDNIRISNISRPIYSPYGEPLDPAYSSNAQTAYPVTSDLYTTYLLDFNSSAKINEDFALIVANSGSYFDFKLNIFDSFGIVNDSETVKIILEKLIYALKPANSKAYLQYYQ